MGIEVATFRLRCAPAQRERTRFAIEDALRTELPDDGRLVLLRRLAVSAPGSARRVGERQAAMRAAWEQATGGARHGGTDGAAEANCVWFASREEAERLLLARLLAGRAVDAWFWKLALPDWRGAPVAAWLAEVLVEALARGDDRRVLAVVETCVAQGAVDRLIAVLVGDAPSASVALPTERPSERPAEAIGDADLSRTKLREAVVRQATAVLAALPVKLRELLVRLGRVGAAAHPAKAAMLRAFALRRSPALALDRTVLESIVAEAAHSIDFPPPPPPRGNGNRRRPPETPRPEARVPRIDTDTEVVANAPLEARPSSSREVIDEETARPASEAIEPPPEIAPFEGQRSRHAGLWLIVPSLAAMGFGEWLAERPDLLAAHPARQLLLAIARHHRIPFDDPALAVLTPDPDEALPEWTALWRHGLDRWLRRHARRRLHDLVRRPGTLAWGDLRLDLRFPMAQADIRLRLLALDRDPGWVPWLGLSVRYHFSEELRA